MRILVMGASGLVGSAVARLGADAGHELLGVAGRWTAAVPGTIHLVTRDLSRPGEAARVLHEMRPDAVINAAAVAEPAACVAAPELSHRLNVELPTELAVSAAAAGVRLVHISSEQVFDGEHAPYAADDDAQPLNLYGRQKLASETRVLDAHPGAAVVRIPLLLGNSLTTRRSVHEKLLELWSSGEAARLYVDEIRQVCSAESVAEALLGLVMRPPLRGTFHWAGAEPVSRCALGRRIAQQFDVGEERIVPVHRADTPAASATRARDLSMKTDVLARELGLTPESLDAALSALQRPAWFTTP